MRLTHRKNLTGYLFVAPWLIALLLFIGYPFVASFYFSFCDYPILRPPLPIGMGNYREIVADSVFRQSLGITMTYASIAIPIGVGFALSLSLLLNARIRGQTVYRVIFYLPHLVPTVAVAILWLWIFKPKFGLLNLILKWVLASLDGLASLFFNLPMALNGGNFFTLGSLCLLAPLGTVFVLRALSRVALTPSLRNSCETAARVNFFLLALCCVLTLYACLHYALPEDINKLHSPGWLSDGAPFPSCIPFAPPWALWALIVMSLWGVGQMAVIYLAKLQDVPIELYEAAEIDGASWLQKTWKITIPMISPVILFNVVMGIIGAFQVFTEPYIMTGGGPEDKTRFVAMFIYDQAFQYHRAGYASAVAWILFILIVLLTFLAFRISRKHVYYAGR